MAFPRLELAHSSQFRVDCQTWKRGVLLTAISPDVAERPLKDDFRLYLLTWGIQKKNFKEINILWWKSLNWIS